MPPVLAPPKLQTIRYNARMIRSIRKSIGVICCSAVLYVSEATAVDRVVSTTAEFSSAPGATGVPPVRSAE